MLCVATKIQKSNIAGIGLFAAKDIPKGTVVWRFQEKIDTLFSESDINLLNEHSQAQFRNYAYFDNHHGKYLLCGDDGRFFNHSKSFNCDDSQQDITIAIRDIKAGEELTVDYNSFYGNKLHNFLLE